MNPLHLRFIKALMTRIMALALIQLSLYLSLTTRIASAGDNIWTWVGVNGTVMQIVTDPLNPSTVYARVGDSFQSTNQIMKSTDDGETWSNIARTDWERVYKIAMASSTPNVLYAATSSGVYRTDDGGRSWEQIHRDPNVQAIAVSPVDWQEAYITIGSTIAQTTNGGRTWTASSDGLPAPYPPLDDIVIAPSAPTSCWRSLSI